jgi:hypothetical protein
MTHITMGLMALCFPLVAFAGGGDDPVNGANEAIEATSARRQAGAEFDAATAPPIVLTEEVPASAEAPPTQIDEPPAEVPVTPEEATAETVAAAEFCRQAGETRTDHVRRLIEEGDLVGRQILEVGGITGDNNLVIQAGRDVNDNRLEIERLGAEIERLDDIDAQLRALRARATALEEALRTAAAERAELRQGLDALTTRVTEEVARLDRDSEFLAARISDNAEVLEAHGERLDALEALTTVHGTRLDGHEADLGQIRKGTQSTVGLFSRMRGSSHGSDLSLGLATGWAGPIGSSPWLREHQLAVTYHPQLFGVGAGASTRFLFPVTSEAPVYVGPEVAVHHAVLGWTDGGGRASGALTTLGGGIHIGYRPQKGSFSAGLTVSGDGGYLGNAATDRGSWAPGGNVSAQLGWSW